MRYLPTSDTIRQEMLDELGLSSAEDLFQHIPEYCRLNRPLNIPTGRAEADIIAWFQQAARDNAPGFTSFVGAGAYHHFRPTHLDNLISRGEWLTAYTPYQPEIAQGTLQSIFEFQTMICQLTGQEVANAGMYDGSTALNEACMMAARVTGRDALVVARSVHPQYRQVLNTLTRNRNFPITEIGFQKDGRLDLAALQAAVTNATAAVAVQSPNFFGAIEDWNAAAAIAHEHGALLIAVIAEPVSLGLLPPPAVADIVAMELQGFGIPVGFGGPYAGILACREKFVRQMPGRLVGEAHDAEGRRGFVLTLSTREQHIRREKATSNICTNQALCALMANIFMATYGKQGLRELAEHNLAKAAYLAQACAKAGLEVLFPAPRFHEFVVKLPRPLAQIEPALTREKLIAGYPLARDYPELGEAVLLCATEIIPRERLDRLADVLSHA
ncbi:MAG: aminomethyl-transferring glycine dehydrogenase subunit GcvPA [Terriglobales bacterium]